MFCHSITCITSKYEDKSKIANITVDIIVDRDSLKKIIIGKNGDKIKKIGKDARIEIASFLGNKVYLELFVKVIKNWREKEKYLKELGLDDLDN